MAIGLREGRWALSRIVTDTASDFPGGAVGFTTAAMRDRLAAQIEAYYPPMDDAGAGFMLGFAVVRLQGGVQQPANDDTRLIPNALLDATLRDLTQAQRTRLRNEIEEWFTGYQFTDYDGTVKVKAAFSAAGYTLDTPIRRILLDLFEHMGHSESRPRLGVLAPHNTEYLDDFSTDPASRWTFESGSAAWDSANNEYDFNAAATTLARYSANDPGSIEQEAQVTAIEGAARCPYVAVRFENAGADDCYAIHSNADGFMELVRWVAASRTALANWTLPSRDSGDFVTWRLAASGAVGANVVLDGWVSNHGTTKPSDPGWIGVDGSPDNTYTDTAVGRHDDSSDIQCGIGGRNGAGDYDTRHCFWKSRAISDRGGGGGPSTPAFRLSLLGVGR